jgi:hypothetical protein
MNYHRPVEAAFAVDGMAVTGGKVYEIAPEDPLECVYEGAPNVFAPVEKALPAAAVVKWSFPARSVSAVELDVRS